MLSPLLIEAMGRLVHDHGLSDVLDAVHREVLLALTEPKE